LSRLSVWQLPHEQAQALSALAQRSMQWQVTVQDGQVWISTDQTSVTVTPAPLKMGDL
jgi:uncharacterized protein YaeQ